MHVGSLGWHNYVSSIYSSCSRNTSHKNCNNWPLQEVKKNVKLLTHKGRRTTYEDRQKPTAKGHLSEGIMFTAICCYL